MVPVKHIIDSVFGLRDVSVDEQRKRLFLSLCILVSVPAVTAYGIIDLADGRSVEGLVILFLNGVLVTLLLLFRYLQNMLAVFRICTLIVLVFLSYEMAIGGGEGYAFLWFYFFPITQFFLLGTKEGVLWVLVSMAIAAVFLFTGLGQYDYGVGVATRFFSTYIIVSVISYALESSRNHYYVALLSEKRSLEEALREVKTLSGLLPVCSHCKKVRDDQGYWNQIELYISEHSDADFSHGICPECAKKYYPDLKIYEENGHLSEEGPGV